MRTGFDRKIIKMTGRWSDWPDQLGHLYLHGVEILSAINERMSTVKEKNVSVEVVAPGNEDVCWNNLTFCTT